VLQVAWLRVDTQTILTIANHVITKNHRIAVTHSGHRTWSLHIKDTRQTDSGWYMCQVNTDPMSSITGFLKVVGNDHDLLILLENGHRRSAARRRSLGADRNRGERERGTLTRASESGHVKRTLL